MDDWCRQQGITKANYYYRLRRVRQAILNYSSEENRDCKQIPDFVELPVPADCLSSAIPSVFSLSWNRMTGILFSFSAEGVVTASKHFYGKAMVFF